MNSRKEDNDNPDYEGEQHRVDRELSFLFGEDLVRRARLVDVVDLNLNDEMTRCISNGVTELKKLRHQPRSQVQLVEKLAAGEQLLLCMWILEMDILDKIQDRSYFSR